MFLLCGTLCALFFYFLSQQSPLNFTEVGNDYATYTFSTEEGLRLEKLQNSFTGDNNVKLPEQTVLFAITSEKGRVSAADFKVVQAERIATEKGEELLFVLEHPNWNAELSVAIDQTEESHWELVLTNKAGSTAKVKVSFPVLGGLVIGGDISTNRIHHGLNGGMNYDGPIRIRGCSGYSFPVMDIYDISNPQESGGVYVRVEDRYGELKTFEILKRQKGVEILDADEAYWPEARADVFDFEEGAGMAVHYQQFEAPAGESLRLPPSTIGVHPYRWERCWENYRRWVNTWYEVKRPRPRWWREVFVHKALHHGHFRRGDDYVIAKVKRKRDDWGWHYLSGGDYVPVKELVKPYDDVYDFNHWMAYRGDYDVRADWGGPEPFARYLTEIRRAGPRSALYMEAVCVERQSNVGREYGEKWSVLQGGVRVTSEPPQEWNMCAGSQGWRDYIARETAKVLSQTRCDAIYLDSVALRYYFCEDTSHDHPYRRGWRPSVVKLLEKVNEAIDRVAPDTVLYLEFWFTDVATQYMSGCFSPVVTAGLQLESKGLPIDPTGTNLFRFYFPDFKIIEIMPENKEGIELSLFNGNAIHGYLIAPNVAPVVERCSRVWRDNVDCFTSDDVEAFLETGVRNVYMNRFGASGKQLYTVWNASNEKLSEVALPVVVPKGWRVTDVLNKKALKVEGGPGETRVVIDLPGRSLSTFAVVY